MKTIQRPDWEALRAAADLQLGWFTTKQATRSGFSAQLLHDSVLRGLLRHPRRGLYRLATARQSIREPLVVAVLWSAGAGVISHETSLALFNLVDPPLDSLTRIQLTVPDAWKKRRLRVPVDVRLHHEPLAPHDLVWLGWGYATHPTRAIAECERDWMDVERLGAAMERAIALGLTSATELGKVHDRLAFRGELARACAARLAHLSRARERRVGG